MKSDIKASILCLTYNHAHYIRQALDSFLAQQTDFKFEILINDDASTDGTIEILKEYQAKHPGIVKPVFHEKNQYQKGKRSFFLRYLIPRAEGKYVATCEGDDFWTDVKKLQKQVDFLEKHPDYTVCFHKVNVAYENGQKGYVYPDVERSSWYTVHQLLKVNYIHTSSVVYRKLGYENTVLNVSPADWYLHLYHASKGKVKFIKETMSTYRKHEAGIWWNYDKDNDKIWQKYGNDHLRMLNALLSIYTENGYQATIKKSMVRTMELLEKVDRKYEDASLSKALQEFPDLGSRYLHELNERLTKQTKEIKKLWEAVHHQDEILAYKQTVIDQKQIEVDKHLSSRGLAKIKALAKNATKR